MATLFNCTETSYESNRGQNVSLSPWKLWKPFALFCGECIAAKSFDSVNFSEKNFKFAMLIIKFYHINEDHRRKKNSGLYVIRTLDLSPVLEFLDSLRPSSTNWMIRVQRLNHTSTTTSCVRLQDYSQFKIKFIVP